MGTNDQELDSNQYLTRVDHRFNDNHRIFGRYVIVPSRWLNNPLLRVNQFTTEFRAQNIGVGYYVDDQSAHAERSSRGL